MGGYNGQAISRFMFVLRRHLFGVWLLVFGVLYLVFGVSCLGYHQMVVFHALDTKRETQNTKYMLKCDLFQFYYI
jgi:hypothetical protein